MSSPRTVSGTYEAMHYILTGSPRSDRPTYVLLHGLGNSTAYWAAVVPLIAGDSATIAVDLPGSGKSPSSSAELDLDGVTTMLAALLDSVDVQSCIVVAHSLGCVVALALTASVPERVERLILISGTLITASEIMRNPGTALRFPRLAAALAAQFAGALVPGPAAAKVARLPNVVRNLALYPFVAHRASIDQGLLEDALRSNSARSLPYVVRAAQSVDLEQLMRAVTVPTDLLWGARDHLISAKDISRAKQALRPERMMCLPDCGHWPPLERPTETARFILSAPPQ